MGSLWQTTARVALATLGLVVAMLPGRLMAAALREVMVYPADHQTRLVLGFTAPVRVHVLTLGNPHRLVLDVPAVAWKKTLADLDGTGLMEGLRYGRLPNGGLRVVIDLPRGVRHTVRFAQRGTTVVADLTGRPGQLMASRDQPSRNQRRALRQDVMGALDHAAQVPQRPASQQTAAQQPSSQTALASLHGRNASASVRQPAAHDAANQAGSLPVPQAVHASLSPSSSKTASLQPMANPIPTLPSRQPDAPAPRSFTAQPYIIAIDAGHGGKDPGAIGPHGTMEKNVTLAIARALAKAIDDLPGMKAVLTRSDDRFIKLRQRVAIARAKHADCFISIHADSVANTRALGSSVYVVSAKGASNEAAKWLAAKENAADLAGGVSLSDQEPDVASVLLDISQSGALAGAQALAQAVLGALDEAGAAMHRTAVQRAPFAVLKAPDMPSILVETAFISNPQEEKLLRSSTYQQTLARAVRDGVLGYVAANPPADGRHWHVVRRGDTMATLATNYGVGLGAVAAANGRRLDGETTISPGEVLFIPGST